MLLSCSGALRGQETRGPLLVGLAGGYEMGWEWSRFPVYASEPDCDQFTRGSVAGIGGSARLVAPSFGGSRFGVMIGVGGLRSTGEFTFAPPDSLVLFVDEAHQVVRAAHEYHYRTAATVVRLDLLCTYAASDRLDIGFGPSVGYRGRTDLSLVESLPSDGVLAFPNGARERSMTDAASLAWRRLGLGVLLRGGGRFPMGGRMMLAPEIALRADILSVVSGTDLRSASAGVSLALLYDLTPAAISPIAPAPLSVVTDDPAPSSPPAPPVDTSLTASLDLYGLDEKEERLPAATIGVMETRRRLVLHLSHRIDFDAGSAALPAIYRRGISGTPLTLDSLLTLDGPTFPLLDIVGLRMRENPAATLTLVPERRAGEREGVGRERADNVRRYLKESWGIDPGRIATEDVGLLPGNANRRPGVALAPDPASLLDSAVAELTTHDLDPPLIAIDPRYHAAAGVRRWTITLDYDGREVGRYASDDPEAQPALNWQGAGDSETPLFADLVVEDSLGGSVAARARLPLLLERSARVVERTVYQDESLERLLFSVPRSRAGMQVIAEIAGALRDGARVTVGAASGDAARDLLRGLRREADARGIRRVGWFEGKGGMGEIGGGDQVVVVEQRLAGR
jgi:hypothetical protein